MSKRMVEIKQGSKWVIVDWKDISSGSVVRFTEPDGSPVKVGRKRIFNVLSVADVKDDEGIERRVVYIDFG